MTITTLIGMTEEEIDRARNEYEHEHFQLEEIMRHYKARMRRRNQKRDIIRALAFNTSSITDFDKNMRRWAKLDELNKHHERDSKRWSAAIDRLNELNRRWLKMSDDLKAEKAGCSA